MGTRQYVEYEGLYHIYFGCRWYGHKHEVCPLQPVCQDSGPVVRSRVPQALSKQEQHILASNGFGPWMVPNKLHDGRGLVNPVKIGGRIILLRLVNDIGLLWVVESTLVGHRKLLVELSLSQGEIR